MPESNAKATPAADIAGNDVIKSAAAVDLVLRTTHRHSCTRSRAARGQESSEHTLHGQDLSTLMRAAAENLNLTDRNLYLNEKIVDKS